MALAALLHVCDLECVRRHDLALQVRVRPDRHVGVAHRQLRLLARAGAAERARRRLQLRVGVAQRGGDQIAGAQRQARLLARVGGAERAGRRLQLRVVVTQLGGDQMTGEQRQVLLLARFGGAVRALRRLHVRVGGAPFARVHGVRRRRPGARPLLLGHVNFAVRLRLARSWDRELWMTSAKEQKHKIRRRTAIPNARSHP